MKQFFLMILLSFDVFLSVKGQDKKISVEDEINSFYRDGFNRNRDNKNIDSTLFYIRKLASNQKGLSDLHDLVHGFLTGCFFGLANHSKDELETYYQILNKMAVDTNKSLVKIAKPLFLSIQIQRNKNDDDKLTNLVCDFIKTQLNTSDLYQNRISMYAFIIYDIISKKDTLKNISEQLIQTAVEKLKKNQNNIKVDTTKSRNLIEETIWYRWMFACANYLQAKNLLKENKIKEAGIFFKIASESIDFGIKKYSVYYYFNMICIFRKEVSFSEDYIRYLKEYSNNKNDLLNVLLAESLINPSKKGTLKNFYNNNFSGGDSFDTYWLTSINNIAQNAPPFTLKKIDGLEFSLAKQKGKWVLIDFWGTWCAACRQEHPELENFYQSIKESASIKIALITVACKDSKKSVSEYMKEFKYSFPVAMTDNIIKEKYHIIHYPSKILITPQGKYIEILILL